MGFYDTLEDTQKIDFISAKVDALEGEVAMLKEEAKGTLKVAGIYRKVLGTAAMLAALSTFGSFWTNLKQAAAEEQRKQMLYEMMDRRYNQGGYFHD